MLSLWTLVALWFAESRERVKRRVRELWVQIRAQADPDAGKDLREVLGVHMPEYLAQFVRHSSFFSSFVCTIRVGLGSVGRGFVSINPEQGEALLVVRREAEGLSWGTAIDVLADKTKRLCGRFWESRSLAPSRSPLIVELTFWPATDEVGIPTDVHRYEVVEHDEKVVLKRQRRFV